MREQAVYPCSNPCPPSRPLCYIGTCYNHCPSYSLQYNSTLCIDSDACQQLGWKMYKDRCVSHCPSWTYAIDDGLSGDPQICDTMVTSIVITVVSVIIISLCCLLFRYQLITKQPPVEEDVKPYESENESRRLLDTDQTRVMSVWTDRSGHHRSRTPDTTDDHSCYGAIAGSSHEDNLDVRVSSTSSHIDREQPARPLTRDEDEMSSVPTIVQLRGFQDSSMDISEFSSVTRSENLFGD